MGSAGIYTRLRVRWLATYDAKSWHAYHFPWRELQGPAGLGSDSSLFLFLLWTAFKPTYDSLLLSEPSRVPKDFRVGLPKMAGLIHTTSTLSRGRT
jgi:hypothetical protein